MCMNGACTTFSGSVFFALSPSRPLADSQHPMPSLTVPIPPDLSPVCRARKHSSRDSPPPLGGIRIAARIHDYLPPDTRRVIVDIGTGEHDQGEPFSTMTRAFLGWIGNEPARPGGILVDIGHPKGSNVVTVSRKTKVATCETMGRYRKVAGRSDRVRTGRSTPTASMRGSDGLVRALRVLETLAGMRQPASLPAITARTSLSKTRPTASCGSCRTRDTSTTPVEVATGSEAAASASPR